MTGLVVAAGRRLGAAAAAGEVLIGEATARSRSPTSPTRAGRPPPRRTAELTAYRVLAVRSAPERDHGMRFVGRQRELTLSARPGSVRERSSAASS